MGGGWGGAGGGSRIPPFHCRPDGDAFPRGMSELVRTSRYAHSKLGRRRRGEGGVYATTTMQDVQRIEGQESHAGCAEACRVASYLAMSERRHRQWPGTRRLFRERTPRANRPPESSGHVAVPESTACAPYSLLEGRECCSDRKRSESCRWPDRRRLPKSTRASARFPPASQPGPALLVPSG